MSERLRNIMTTVLVTGIGSNIGQGIFKALKMSQMPLRIIGTDMNPDSAGFFWADKAVLMPPVKMEREYREKLIEVCNRESVDLVLIGSDPEVPFYSSHKDLIEQITQARVIVSNPFVINTFHDKWETANFLDAEGLASPLSSLEDTDSVTELVRTAGFPLMVKPRIGSGSKGMFVARSEEELSCALAFVKNAVVQEYIEGDEYTSGLFFDGRSRLRGIITMKRDLCFGTTYRAVVDDFAETRAELNKVAGVLSSVGAVGPINVQSRCRAGRAYTLEVNPRFSGTTAFRARFGFNESEAVVRNFAMGEEVEELKPSKGVVLRYWEELYIMPEDMERMRSNVSSGD